MVEADCKITFRIGVDPLRCAIFGASHLTLRFRSRPPFGRSPTLRVVVHAARKPGVGIRTHPFDACVSPLEAAGKTFCAFGIVHRAESRGFTIRGKSRSSHATSPCFSRSVA
jgi:hypothetical protein